MSLLEIEKLKVTYEGRDDNSRLVAVDNVSFALEKGEILGLVGESGCGKSSLGNAVIGLTPIESGVVRYDGTEINNISNSDLNAFRRNVQMIFQDPFGSLNPRMSAGECLMEVLKVHEIASSQKERESRVRELFKLVGLDPSWRSRYPHEFSGGQRQRIGIARALAVSPDLIIADEPVSALDVSVQVQILNLMKDLKEKMDLSYVFIAHDLGVVRYMCDRVYVMYLGRIVESAKSDELFKKPSHPYTEALLSAVPDVDKGLASRKSGKKNRIVLQGDVPSPTENIPGCPFHPRCHKAKDICSKEIPPEKTLKNDHISVCHFS